MKQRCWVLLLILSIAIIFGSCKNKDEDFSISLEESTISVSDHGDHADAVKYLTFGDGKIVRFYSEKLIDENVTPNLSALDIYDLSKGQVIKKIDLSPYQIPGVNINAQVTKDYFYINNPVTLSYIVFSHKGDFVKQIDIPNSRMRQAVCLANDLTKIAYESSEPTDDGIGYPFIIKDLQTNEEKTLLVTSYRKNEISVFTDIFFNESNDKIGFKAQTNSVVGEQSVDCYGYVDLANGKPHITIRNKTAVSSYSNTLFVFDEHMPYQQHSNGIIRALNISTEKALEYKTVTVDESQFVYIVNEIMFITAVDNGNGEVQIRIYENGKNIISTLYQYHETSADISDINYDKITKTLFVEHYSMDKLNNIVTSIDVS